MLHKCFSFHHLHNFTSPSFPPHFLSLPHRSSNPLLLPSNPGYHNYDLELKTPTDLTYVPPTPLRSDEFFEGDASVESPTKTSLSRPSDLTLAQTTSTSSTEPSAVVPHPGAEPPIVGPEDTTLTGGERATSLERPDNDRRAAEQSVKRTEDPPPGRVSSEHQEGKLKDDVTAHAGSGNGREEEEEEEMTQEKLRSLLEDIKLEGGMEEEEMTEEKVNAILEQVRQAEKDMSSVSGWRGEASGAAVESAAAGHGASAEEGR